MSKAAMPESKNWNHYWSLDQTKRFTKISWSKRRIMAVLKSYCNAGSYALDAGCGSGFFSKFFCDQQMKTVSLDYSPKALQIAESLTHGQSRLVQASLLKERLQEDIPERFDIIFSDGLLEHFTEDEQNQILTNFKNLLSPKGVIITFVPNKWSPWELIRPLYMPGIEEKPFVLKELKLLHKKNGLNLVRSGGVNTIPFKYSPDGFLGKNFGMLLYTIADLHG